MKNHRPLQDESAEEERRIEIELNRIDGCFDGNTSIAGKT